MDDPFEKIQPVLDDVDEREIVEEPIVPEQVPVPKPKSKAKAKPKPKVKAKKPVKKMKPKKVVKAVKVVKTKPKAKPKKHVKAKPKLKVHNKPLKRGPHGPQWLRWKVPYQDSSIMGKLFAMASKKGGVKIKEAVRFVKGQGGNVPRALKYLRSGHSKGWVWDVDDSHNRIRVSAPKIGNKNWKKK